MEVQEEMSEGGRHGCGKCFTSFSTPEMLQKHCLTCFEDSALNVGSSAVTNSDFDRETATDVDNNTNSFSITLDDEDDDDPMAVSEKSDSLSTFETLGHPAFDSIMSRNNEPGGRCIRIIAGKKIMQCTICLKTFTNYNSFKRHRRMHVSGAAFHCVLCNRNFFRRYLWKNHMERNHGKIITDDSLNSETKLGYDDFSSASPMKKKNWCYMCKSTFKTNNALTDHLRIKHCISQVAFPVHNNDKSSDDEMEVDENANVKKGSTSSEGVPDDWERPASEGVPEFNSEKYDVPSTHSSPGPLTDLKGSAPSLVLDRQSKLVINVDAMNSEMSDDQDIIQTFPCLECGTSFTDEFDLQIHAMKAHKQTVFRCLFCYVSFGERDLLKAHLESHRGNESFICYMCKYEAADKGDLKSHFDAAHDVSQSNCSDSFEEDEDREIGDLSEDVVVVHPEPVVQEHKTPAHNNTLQFAEENYNGVSVATNSAKLYSCCVCSEKFDQKECFFKHIRIHMYLFCECCGRQFINKNEMLKHQTKCIFGSNRSCYICQAPFDSVLRLKYHVFLHLSETNSGSSISVQQLINQKPMNEASKRVDSLLRNKGLLPAAKEDLSVNLKEFNAGYESNVSFTKSFVPSSGIHSAISVTLTPVDKPTKEETKNDQNASSSKAHACIQCGKDFVRQELLQRHMIRDHVFKKGSMSKVKLDGVKCNAGKSISQKRPAESQVSQATTSDAPLQEEKRSSTPPLNMPSPSDLRNKVSSVLLPIESKDMVSLLNHGRQTAKFRCRHCTRSFTFLAGLNQHLMEHFIPYFCKFCAMPFSEQVEMMAHNNAVHGRAQRYYCYTCCTNVGNSAELKQHIASCHGPPVHEESVPSLTPAVMSPHSFGTYKECKACHKKFVNEKRLMNHTCSGSADGVWMCEICNISFPQSSHLASHQQQAHKSNEVYRCDVCGLSGHKDFIITHMITIHMTKVSSAMNNANSGQQSSLTITPIAQPVPMQTKLLLHIDPVNLQNQRSSLHHKDSMFATPRNPSEIQITYKQPSTSTSRTIDVESKVTPPTRDFCIICNKTFPSSEFPEHMFREHCGGVKIMSSSDKNTSPAKSADNDDRKNVIEIITKEEPKAEMSIQIVR